MWHTYAKTYSVLKIELWECWEQMLPNIDEIYVSMYACIIITFNRWECDHSKTFSSCGNENRRKLRTLYLSTSLTPHNDSLCTKPYVPTSWLWHVVRAFFFSCNVFKVPSFCKAKESKSFFLVEQNI